MRFLCRVIGHRYRERLGWFPEGLVTSVMGCTRCPVWKKAPRDSRWIATAEHVDGEVHVLPLEDLVEHADADCVCGTTTEPVPRQDGSTGWLVTHHSLDGREANE